jgi:hypothetical protein
MILKAHQSNTGSLTEEVGKEIEMVGESEKQKAEGHAEALEAWWAGQRSPFENLKVTPTTQLVPAGSNNGNCRVPR